MGHVSVVSGHIREAHYFGGDIDRRRLLSESNRRAIEALPIADEWPALTSSMFAITGKGEGSHTTPQYRGRVIHFGASYKELLDSFATWRSKFEALLRRLYWDDAAVMVHTEWWGHYVFEWMPTAATADGFRENPPRPVSEWSFRGWRLGNPGDIEELTSDDVDRLVRS